MNKRELKQIITEEIRSVLEEQSKAFKIADKATKIIQSKGKNKIARLSNKPSHRKDLIKYFRNKFYAHLRGAVDRAMKQLSNLPGVTPDMIATLATDEVLKTFRAEAPHGNSGIGGAERAKLLRPLISSSLRAALSSDAKLDTPDRKAGDNPVSPAKKPVDPRDTTQQSGVLAKIEQQERIIKKFGRRIGIRNPVDLNNKVGLPGQSEITPETIEAIKKLQQDLDFPEDKVDGLYGGQTFRAHRRALRKR